MVRVQRMTSEFDPSFSACCQALNAEVAGLGTTLEHLPRTELIVAIKQHTIVGLAQLQGNFLAKSSPSSWYCPDIAGKASPQP